MKKRKVAARICAFVLAAGLAVVSPLSVFATEVPETDLSIRETDLSAQEADVEVQETDLSAREADVAVPEADGQESGEGGQENNGDLIYVDGVPYSGYYMDSAGVLYTVSEGAAKPAAGMVEAGTEYYSCDEVGVMTPMTFPGQTVFVEGKAYTGYYMDSAGILYMVSEGAAELAEGAVAEGTEYYSFDEAEVMMSMTLPSRTLYVEGKAYTGYYMDKAGRMYRIKKTRWTLRTGTLAEGTEYYSGKEGEMKTLSRQTLYVEGKVYTGYYMDKAGRMYHVKKGTRTLKTGLAKKRTKYYSYNAGKTKTLSKQTLYVKGKVYTGYYMNKAGRMYRVKKGTRTLWTGTAGKGTKYYSYNVGKTKTLGKQTLYVKGKVYAGYYLNKADRMCSVKKGTKTLQTGLVEKGTKYYSYNAGKTKKLSKQTLYVKGKVYTGYYLDKADKMYSVKNGTCTPATAVINAGTKYYSYKEGKTKTLAGQTLYVEGKVYAGYYLGSDNKMYYYANGGTSAPVNTALGAGTGYYSCNENRLMTLPARTVYVYGKAATGMSPESLATLERAQAVVAGITNESMTREQKLRVCFDYVKVAYPEIKPRIPHYKGMDWPVVYANDMFVRGAGNCCSYAAAFAYMARAIGYEEVYCCNSGGHGWAEIDGLIYDPEWSKWHHVYNYFALSYDTRTDQGYKGAIQGWQQAGKLWMHVKI